MIDIIEGEDFYNDTIYIHQEEQTQSSINNLKKNLSEKSLYTQLFNNYKFEKIMEEKENQEGMNKQNMGEKEDQKKWMDIDKKEQIDEVKINMFMILFNECDNDSKKDEYPYIDNNYIITRRLIIEDCKINENKLKVDKKDYVFIPIQSNPIFKYDEEIIKIENKNNKNKKIPVLIINNSEAWNEETFKEKYKKLLDKEIEYLNEHKKSTTKSNSGQNFSVKTDNSEGEINGIRFYNIIDDNNIRRFIYSRDYKKEIDGFYTRHKEIDLGIEGEVKFEIKSDDNSQENYNYLIQNYSTNNNLKAHILFKNFKEKVIPKDKPIILEVKKSFKIYDLLNQIKQISKVSKNLTLNEDNNEISKFPKYIIGYLCNFNDGEVKRENLKLLNENYKGTDKSLLEHDLDIINKNDVKVVICLIKDEKIMGYDLSIEDYNSKEEGKQITKRVDLTYLCEKIFPNENKKNLINSVMNKYKEKYISLTFEKTVNISDYYEGINKIKTEIKRLNDENKEVKTEIKEVRAKNKAYQTEIKRLNDENKEVRAKNKAYQTEIERLKHELEELKKSNNVDG